MEMKTIIRLGIAVAAIVLSVLFVGGIVGGRHMTYQLPTQYTAEDTNNYSAVQVAMTIQDDKIIDCKITSSGENDLLKDDTRAEWAKSIVDTQSPENDVISGATLAYSAASVQKAANEILVAANLRELAADAEGLAEAEAIEAGETATGADYKDGTYSIQQTTDFSTIDIGITVKDGQITEATIASEGANDLLTDEHRNGWEDQIVAKQAVDAVSGVTVSSTAVQEALDELLAQASGGGAAGGLADGAYSIQKTTDFSTIDVGITVEGGKITEATIASEGANDLLTDEHRNGWAEQIVAGQSVDAVSGVTVSSTAVKEALDELLAQASGGSGNNEQVAELEAALAESESRLAEAEARIAELEAAAAAAAAVTTPAEETEPETAPVEEPKAAAGLADGAYSVQKITDFSTIDVGFTVEGGKITEATIASEGTTDLLTDDIRNAWAEQIVADQAIDAVSGVTVSSGAVEEAVAELLAQAAAGEAAPAAEPEAAEAEAPAEEPVAVEEEAPAEETVTAEAEAPDEEPVAVEEEAPAEEAGLADGAYSVQKITDFSTIDVGFTVEGGKITEATIASEGTTDLLTDDIRNAWAEQIVADQAIDAVSGVTVSSGAVEEAVAELLAQAAAREAAPAAEPEAAEAEAPAEEPMAVEEEAPAEETVTAEAEAPDEEPVAVEEEAPAEEAGLADGAYSVQKITDFSTIDVGFTVEGGKITDASVSSEGTTDLLTDDIRNAWAEQIVADQAIDAVSGVTVSSGAVEEAVAELLAQAAAGEAAPAAEPEAAEAEAPAEEPVVTEAEAPAEETETPETEAPAEETVTTEAKAPAEEAEAGEVEAPAEETEAPEAEAPAEEPEAAVEAAAETDAERFMRPRPAVGSAAPAEEPEAVKEEAPAEEPEATVEAAAETDAERFMRPRPAAGGAAPAEEPEAVKEETPAEEPEAAVEAAAETDAERFMRPRPAAGSAAPAEEAETVEAEAPAEEPEAAVEAAAETDAERFMRPRPAAGSAAPAEEPEAVEEEAPAGEAGAEAESDAAQTASILPYIVTTMGANSENSYVVDYLEQDPYLVNIYEGYGFAKDYGSARGHNYTLEDVAKTQRPHPKANCLTCKTPDMHKMIEEQGVAVYSMPFDEVMEQMTQPVGCYTCHGDDMGNGGQLKVTHQYVNEALGDNASAIQPATLSCGQCHIEYYFTPEDSEAMMPYHSVSEMTPEAILAYYDAMDFADWTQESTGTRLLKAQHPEMETVLQGKHAAFLTCADCHMPTETTDEGVAYRSHKLVSPLESESLLQSCATCHGETDMTAFVHDIQDRVTARETEVGNKLSDMKDALAEAVASGTWTEDELNAVRKLHREAQWFFDYCYVENAEGAHNSELAMSCLDTSEAKIDEALALLNAAKS